MLLNCQKPSGVAVHTVYDENKMDDLVSDNRL